MIFIAYYVGMHISRASWSSSNGKVYQSIYLRESYREGPHVRKRNIANLTHADPQEIAAIELALKYKGDRELSVGLRRSVGLGGELEAVTLGHPIMPVGDGLGS